MPKQVDQRKASGNRESEGQNQQRLQHAEGSQEYQEVGTNQTNTSESDGNERRRTQRFKSGINLSQEVESQNVGGAEQGDGDIKQEV